MSRLSLTRTGSSEYSRGYLKSPAWHERRRQWFEDCRQAGFEPVCQVCEMTKAQLGGLDLHHLSYEGVSRELRTRRWVAAEDDADLMPMCRWCHQDLHRIMDRGRDYYGWDRTRATITILTGLRQRLRHDPAKQHRLAARQSGRD